MDEADRAARAAAAKAKTEREESDRRVQQRAEAERHRQVAETGDLVRDVLALLRATNWGGGDVPIQEVCWSVERVPWLGGLAGSKTVRMAAWTVAHEDEPKSESSVKPQRSIWLLRDGRIASSSRGGLGVTWPVALAELDDRTLSTVAQGLRDVQRRLHSSGSR